MYLLRIVASLHELGDGHAAGALPLAGGRLGGSSLRRSGRVSLGARGCLGFFTGFLPSSRGEVGPLARNWKSLLAKAGQDLCVHVPAGAFVGGALLVNGVAADEAPQMNSDRFGERKKKALMFTDSKHND